MQDRDAKIETEDDFNFITNLRPNEAQIADLLFARLGLLILRFLDGKKFRKRAYELKA